LHLVLEITPPLHTEEKRRDYQTKKTNFIFFTVRFNLQAVWFCPPARFACPTKNGLADEAVHAVRSGSKWAERRGLLAIASTTCKSHQSRNLAHDGHACTTLCHGRGPAPLNSSAPSSPRLAAPWRRNIGERLRRSLLRCDCHSHLSLQPLL
jgi:hypothetical protein